MKFGGPIRVSVESKTQIGWKAMVDLKTAEMENTTGPKHELTSNKTMN